MTDTETYYTTAEAAKALGMRTSQVSRACAAGTIRGVLKDVPNPRCGHTYRIPAASLEEYRAMREAHRVYDAARRTARGEELE